ncbi:MAG: hypothetical protein FWC62_03520 [Firmicutes bacterium]|nr:hypothetical protein [Bacillota bacterium]
MKKVQYPVSYYIGCLMVFLGVVAYALNRWVLNPQLDWLSIVGAALSLVGALVLVSTIVKLAKAKKNEK